MTPEQMRDLVKECGLDWHRGYEALFDATCEPVNRYAVLIEAVEAAERERCAKQEPVAWRYWKDKFGCWEYSDTQLEFPAVPAGTKMIPLYAAPVAVHPQPHCNWPECGCRIDLGNDWKACEGHTSQPGEQTP